VAHGAVLLEIRLRDPTQDEAFVACWAEARALLEERYHASHAELMVSERGRYVALVELPLPGVWKLVRRDPRWQAIEARCPKAETEVRLLRLLHTSGTPRDLTTAELARWLDERRAGRRDFVLADALPRQSFHRHHLPGSVSLPLDELDRTEAQAVIGDSARPVVVYCSGYQ
jgi:hypothetical protein